MFDGDLYVEQCRVCGEAYHTDGGDLTCGSEQCEAVAAERQVGESTERDEQALVQAYEAAGL